MTGGGPGGLGEPEGLVGVAGAIEYCPHSPQTPEDVAGTRREEVDGSDVEPGRLLRSVEPPELAPLIVGESAQDDLGAGIGALDGVVGGVKEAAVAAHPAPRPGCSTKMGGSARSRSASSGAAAAAGQAARPRRCRSARSDGQAPRRSARRRQPGAVARRPGVVVDAGPEGRVDDDRQELDSVPGGELDEPIGGSEVRRLVLVRLGVLPRESGPHGLDTRAPHEGELGLLKSGRSGHGGAIPHDAVEAVGDSALVACDSGWRRKDRPQQGQPERRETPSLHLGSTLPRPCESRRTLAQTCPISPGYTRAARRRSSVGQSTALVKRGSRVRIPPSASSAHTCLVAGVASLKAFWSQTRVKASRDGSDL